MSKIVKLISENVKRIKAVEIIPTGSTVVIGGKNAQGKSSVLDSIEMALGGTRSIPAMPIHTGEETARVVLQTETLKVERKFTATGSTLTVTANNGQKCGSPQKLLDELYGRLMRDPLEFCRMEPLKQLETLKKLVGLDFTELDARREQLYTDRTLAGRDVSGRQQQYESMPYFEGVPSEEVMPEQVTPTLVDLTDLNAKLETATANNKRIQDGADYIAARQANISAAQAKIEQLQNYIKNENTLLVDAQKKVNGMRLIPVEPIKAEIEASQEANRQAVDCANTRNAEAFTKANQTNEKVRANKARARLQAQFEEKKAEYDRLTDEIEAIDEEKKKLLGEAKFPLPGLSFGTNGVKVNGVPFEQASSAEQLKVSTAMALALCPNRPDALKILLVRDGSLLDSDSLKVMQEIVSQHDAQLWLEMVTEDADKATVIISDGKVQK